MAKNTVAAIRPESTRPNISRARREEITYIDNERDYRDILIHATISGAILIMEEAEDPRLAADMLRLARDQLHATLSTERAKEFKGTAILEGDRSTVSQHDAAEVAHHG